ncbi:MAG: hypothetical protein GF346_01625, partial [Candidatus Eisenbacteria bacterium]|nr:hypothetical protein [Candidatus Latescibacterota bacterium]MBD3301130.1 hypothetical protein [Candidatus Eisenbacteria bacterium]
SVLDLADPAQPVQVTTMWSTAILSSVAMADGRAYLGGGPRVSGFEGFLDVVDLSDPANPVVVASLEELPIPVNRVAVNGDAIYASAGSSRSGILYVVDAADLAALELVHIEEFEFELFGLHVADGILYFCEDRLTGGLHFASAPADVRPKALESTPWPRDIHSIAVQADLLYLTDTTPMLKVVDVSDPADTRVIGAMYTAKRAEVVEAHGDFAYIGYATRTLDVADVSNPQSPHYVTTVPQADGVADLVALGSLLFAVGGDGLRVIDISDPASPSVLGQLSVEGIAIAVEGTYAYVLDGYRFRVVDVADPAVPTLIGALDTEAARDFAMAGQHAFLIDWRGVQIVDVTDPSQPVEVGRIEGIEMLDATAIDIRGDHAYLARERMAVVDIGDPLQPVVLGESETVLDAFPRDLAADEEFVAVAGESFRVFPVQCPGGTIRPERAGAVSIPLLTVAPNPMRDRARIEVSLGAGPSGIGSVPVRASVIDVTGRQVARLARESLAAGIHVFRWEGRRDADGRPAPAGLYWLRVEVAGMPPQVARIVRLGGE